MSLFRSDAIQKQQQKLYGSIFLARPFVETALTWLFTGIALLVIVFFCVAGYTRKEVVSGLLMPEHGVIKVFSARAGVISEVKVAEGQKVSKGDPLFVVTSDEGEKAGAATVVAAREAGIITTIHAMPGQVMALNQPLASMIADNDPLEAELYAPTRSIGFVQPGQKVQIKYQAFPYQKYGQYAGTVKSISGMALAPAATDEGCR
jgi:multidrug resistance efflux pump